MEERQQAIESLTYEAAHDRMKQEHEQLKRLEISTGLKATSLKGWMWEWYNKLRQRLANDIRKAKALADEHDGGTLTPVIRIGPLTERLIHF